MSEFVSTHIISKERTNLGLLFLDSAFTSLWESGFPNEIILVDNGSSKLVREKLYDEWRDKFKVRDIELKIYDNPSDDFGALRNFCIEKTYENANIIFWQDTDEIYYPEDLDTLKAYVFPEHPKASQFYSSFFHFMFSPFTIQVTPDKLNDLSIPYMTSLKDNIFRFHKGLKWVKEKKVHEKLSNLLEGPQVDTDVQYLHMGYTRRQWEQAIKWMHYSMLEFGHLGPYKKENIELDEDGNDVTVTKKPVKSMTQKEYFRDWRSVDQCLADRRSICTPFPNQLISKENPTGFNKLIENCANEVDWLKMINTIDSSTNHVWEEWQRLYKKYGVWSLTLDEMFQYSRVHL